VSSLSCPVSDRARAETPAPPEVWCEETYLNLLTPGRAGIAVRPRSETGHERAGLTVSHHLIFYYRCCHVTNTPATLLVEVYICTYLRSCS